MLDSTRVFLALTVPERIWIGHRNNCKRDTRIDVSSTRRTRSPCTARWDRKDVCERERERGRASSHVIQPPIEGGLPSRTFFLRFNGFLRRVYAYACIRTRVAGRECDQSSSYLIFRGTPAARVCSAPLWAQITSRPKSPPAKYPRITLRSSTPVPFVTAIRADHTSRQPPSLPSNSNTSITFR